MKAAFASIAEVMKSGPVMPVIVIDRLDDAVPLARALVAGGVRVLEVTLRTPVALDAIAAISEAVPDAIVGAGTILNAHDLKTAGEAGARFGVSPGATTDLLRAARSNGWTFLPGVMTPSEAMKAVAEGFAALKFFPAVPAGGVQMLKAIAGPLPQLRFCPTGGISPATAPDFLSLANVDCIGGSWLAPRQLVEAGDWAAITALAAQASQLGSGV
ncbi:bifunctional 4-hydroxy-2-oxoglutarate aldolase/2-dehydro-3-deoxy-phosphogluconate aldolase [Solimonas marina]|uniref:2-dehydro-3-deoxy-phosphogluconate aldolase n=1 Tax=Solimonas marina TaxID=2714601 RepID=A0A969WB09_9GAMM|nr:bifunctional 4-hydroxy-2-oxoglutarate aldolase/2-dehydro-3-deoxy-phosphogluconate aldolase [Solimonas marina]NKF24086.1 bifunctional 4-hydroxy-2-oxoglutarate aldolase/2-dehydro-3-deoxy-phosphogluconate aldolase [Solimonas marina]